MLHGGMDTMDIARLHRLNQIKTIDRDKAENKKTEPPAQTQSAETDIPEAPAMEDTVEISTEAIEKARDKKFDFQNALDEMHNKMRELREGLQRAREAGEGAAAMWKEKIRCMQIAMRIMAGDIVPEEDHRYLREKDIELYSKAIQLRIEKEDPEEYDRLSEDEEEDAKNIAGESATAAPATPAAPAAQAASPTGTEAAPAPAE